MGEKRSLGIKMISLYIIFIPLILLLVAKIILSLNYTFNHAVMHPLKFLEVTASLDQSWPANPIVLTLGLLLAIGLLCFNNAARLGAITLMGFKALFSIVSLVTIYANISPSLFSYIVKQYGYDDVLLPLVIFTIFFLGNGFAVFYLTRPKVKEQFFKEPKPVKDRGIEMGMKKKAFTLIELIIVVVIVGILAMVAIPRYFANVEKARKSSAYYTMRSIREAIMGYYAANSLYPSGFPITVTVDNDAVMVVGSPNSNTFTYTYSSTTITAAPGPGACTYNMTVSTGATSVNGTGC